MTTTRIFLLAGQSNMAGGARVGDLPTSLHQAPPSVRLFTDGTFKPLVYRESFGPEVGFAHAVAADSPVVLCKTARGGANLNYDWQPDGVQGGPEDEYRGPLYPQFMADIEALRRQLDREGIAWRFAGMLWMQGERDSVIEPFAHAYEANLRAFIQRVRRDLDVAELPFVMGRVCPAVLRFNERAEVVRNHAHREIVRTAQTAVAAALPAVAIVETDDLPLHDHLHFNAPGQILLGQRFARALSTLT